jgi:hypothetical protein
MRSRSPKPRPAGSYFLAQSDIDMLITFAGAQPPGIGLDEFVCDVVQSAMDMRAIENHTHPFPSGEPNNSAHRMVNRGEATGSVFS